jgi:Glycosyl hydrolases family 25
MTIFGWDTSHYDGAITPAIAARAHAEGIVFATAKIGEGGNYDDPADGSNLKAFRDAGIKVIGGYYVVRSGISISAQVAHCIALADKDEPWWRTFPGWFWQTDLELWGIDQVGAATGIAFSEQLRAATGRTVVLYASHGMYGDKLRAWGGPLWNANYGANPTVPFRDAYPGDNSLRWGSYSGQIPALLQYGSNTKIAGLTTCDANAFRGTLDELLALIRPSSAGDTTMAGFDAGDAHFLLTFKGLPADTPTESLGTAVLGAQNNSAAALKKLDQLIASQAGQDKALAAQTLAIQALASSGGVDAAPILAAIADVKATETSAFADLLAENRSLLAKLAAAEKASAAALAATP